MSRFATAHQSIGAPALLAQHGETVTYTPDGGDATSVSAIVYREPIESRGPDGNVRLEYALSIALSKADVATVTTGADTVALKKRSNSASDTTFRVTSIVEQSGGMWLLGLN